MKKLKDLLILVKKELLICIAVPLLIAAAFNTSGTQGKDFLLFLMVGAFCIFSYAVVKMFFVIQKNRAGLGGISGEVKSSEAEETRIWNKSKSGTYLGFVLITAVLMPVTGLTINNGGIFGGGAEAGGVFGNFSNIWFYIIAVLNGIVMLADIRADKRGLGLFYLKVAGFTYITYFAIVFMPVLPYGLIGMVFFGLGVLIFAPIAVFITETFQILQDVQRLKTRFKTGVIIAAILGVITIPAALTVSFSIDKANFNHALTYLSYDGQEMPDVNLSRLKTTLAHINHALENRQQRFDIFDSGMSIPLISKYYQMIALDNRIVPLDTANRLGQIFFGETVNQPMLSENSPFADMEITNLHTDTQWDEKSGLYETWVDLEIKNNSDFSLAEYKTEFILPEGCFIKDYYLYVGDERKQGILADKRAALITYNNIIRTPKDPGILYYKSDQMMELRVYPFNMQEVRKTGFLVRHSQNETIEIDGNTIRLAAEKTIDEPIDMQGVSFVPAAVKRALPARARKPEYYFIIDASENSPYEEHVKKAESYIEDAQITEATLYAVSYKVEKAGENTVKGEGGFNLPLAMEMIFRDQQENAFSFPVMIVVSDNIGKAPVFQKSSMAKQFPESLYYYNLGYDLSLTPYSFSDHERQDIVKRPVLTGALDYHGQIVADDGRSEIVISGDPGSYTDDAYKNALILYAKSLVYGNDSSAQIELVRDSFRQRLLTKYTAFTVLETKEQERELLELQEKFLNNDGEDVPLVTMDEPGLLACAGMALVLGLVFYRKKSSGF